MKKSLKSLAFLFQRKHFPLLFFLVVFLSLPLFVFVLSQTQDIRQRAASNSNVSFVNEANQEITQITTPEVRVRLNAPWPVKTLAAFNSDVLGQASGIFQPKASFDDVNEVDGKLDPVSLANSKTLWVGNGGTQNTSYTGIRYPNITIPKNARILSAQLQLRPVQETWISMSMSIAGDATGNSAIFSSTSLPSSRSLTTQKVAHKSDSKWKTGRWYILSDVSPVIQEIVRRSDWESGNSLSLILKGTGGSFGRKSVYSFDGDASFAPRLSIVYETTGGVIPILTPTRVPTNTPLPTPTKTPTPTLTPTPTPQIAYIESITLAEDSNFTQNTKTISSVSENPLVTPYTFSTSTTGVKNLYVKFKATTGEERVTSASIILVENTPTPTSTHTHGDNTNSMAMGRWNPNPKFDTCPNPDDTLRIKEIHDSYKVKGPDGKWYPTWHPPVDPATGCKFGHEHGRDPKGSEIWATKQIQNYFYYDENKNGMMDASEETVTGLPFGYANEQLDVYNSSRSQTWMRHEDHVGHKVEYANGEADIATHHGSETTGGVYVQKNSPITRTTVKCYYLAKPHQGVSTGDAFVNNIHEVFYFADCRDETTPSNNQKISTAMIEGFGQAGGFTRLGDMCGIARPDQNFITIGTTAANASYPNGDGDRQIITRDCVEIGFLVPAGQFSGNMYEAWPANLAVKSAAGKTLLTGISLLFDVEDANRYYYPEDLKQQRGYKTPAPTNVGYTMDLCYDTSLSSQGRKYRGGPCDWATNYGQIKDITWDDPRSGFRGVHRGMYFQPPVLENSGGSEIWYSDPFGQNAQTTPFPGSIKQQITAKNLNYGQQFGFPIDPSVVDRTHNDGGNTVHAPN